MNNKYAGTQTEKNLEAAFAGESQAIYTNKKSAVTPQSDGVFFIITTTETDSTVVYDDK